MKERVACFAALVVVAVCLSCRPQESAATSVAPVAYPEFEHDRALLRDTFQYDKSKIRASSGKAIAAAQSFLMTLTSVLRHGSDTPRNRGSDKTTFLI
jgi:hypothetical protein